MVCGLTVFVVILNGLMPSKYPGKEHVQETMQNKMSYVRDKLRNIFQSFKSVLYIDRWAPLSRECYLEVKELG